jgi:hypothetical protein
MSVGYEDGNHHASVLRWEHRGELTVVGHRLDAPHQVQESILVHRRDFFRRECGQIPEYSGASHYQE